MFSTDVLQSNAHTSASPASCECKVSYTSGRAAQMQEFARSLAAGARPISCRACGVTSLFHTTGKPGCTETILEGKPFAFCLPPKAADYCCGNDINSLTRLLKACV